MHELSIAQHLLDVALRTAQEHGGLRVLAVHVRTGEFAMVAPECLEFAFEALAMGTLAEGAGLCVTQDGADAQIILQSLELEDAASEGEGDG